MSQLTFRPLAEPDLPQLAAWLGAPHVFEWWREASDLPTVEKGYLPAIRGEEPTEVFVLVVDGRDIGMFQRYRISAYAEWLTAFRGEVPGVEQALGIDYLIGDPSLIRQGTGSAAIRQFTEQSLAAYPDAESVVVACQQANPASWRALEKAGYTREWAGMLDSDDPSDAGPSYVYRSFRPS